MHALTNLHTHTHTVTQRVVESEGGRALQVNMPLALEKAMEKLAKARSARGGTTIDRGSTTIDSIYGDTGTAGSTVNIAAAGGSGVRNGGVGSGGGGSGGRGVMRGATSRGTGPENIRNSAQKGRRATVLLSPPGRSERGR
jgi:hypothetical protein